MLDELKKKIRSLPANHQFIIISIMAVLMVFFISGIIGGLVFVLPTWLTITIVIILLSIIIYKAWKIKD